MARAWTHWTRPMVLAAIRRFYEATGHWPRRHELHSDQGLPSQRTVACLFGTLAAARGEAGMPGDGIVRRTAEERAKRAFEVRGE